MAQEKLFAYNQHSCDKIEIIVDNAFELIKNHEKLSF